MPILDYINRMNHLYGNNPSPTTSAAKKAADVEQNTRIAKTLYDHHDDTRFNKTTGRFEDSVGTPISPQEYLKDQKNLQKAVDDLSPKGKDFYYDPSTQQFERRDNPPPHKPLKFGSAPHRRKYPEQYKTINELEDLKKFQNGTYKEPTAGTAAHRKKYPERYGYKYTSKLDQLTYPNGEKKAIPRKRDHFRHFVKTGGFLEPTKEEIEKAKAPSTWDLLKQTAKTYEEKKDIREIINKEYKRNGMSNLTKDEIKYVDKSLIKPVKIFDSLDPTTYLSNAEQRRAVLTPKKFTDKPQYPEVVVDHIRLLEPKDTKQEAREAAQERLREFAFRKTPDPDAVKGIGSFKDVIGKKLRAANSKSDWEARVNFKYKDYKNA